MNTVSSIVTFLMVFLIQRSQNKDTLAMQIKLNEIVAALRGASNRLINVESLSEDEVRAIHRRYEELARRAERSGVATRSLSIEHELDRRSAAPAEAGTSTPDQQPQPTSPVCPAGSHRDATEVMP